MEKLRLGIWRPSLKQLYNNLNNISIPALIAGLLIVMVSVIISEIIKQGQIHRTQNLVETYADELSARIEEKLNTRFSILNFGHENGDTVLKAIEAEIKGSEVPNSVSCRIGGEELSLVLTHEAETDAVPIARNIQNLLYDLKLKEIENSKVTVSFGVASYEKSQPINEWHEVAGKALYHSKRNDRNRIGEAREIKNQNGK
jgi:diguanylate cyclase (GGDEF)-like protein